MGGEFYMLFLLDLCAPTSLLSWSYQITRDATFPFCHYSLLQVRLYSAVKWVALVENTISFFLLILSWYYSMSILVVPMRVNDIYAVERKFSLFSVVVLGGRYELWSHRSTSSNIKSKNQATGLGWVFNLNVSLVCLLDLVKELFSDTRIREYRFE